MAHTMLRPDDPWPAGTDTPDLRGWEVRDEDDELIGRVGPVVVDTEEDEILAVVLGANHRYTAEEIRVGEGVLYVQQSGARKQIPWEAGLTGGRDPEAGLLPEGSFEAAYQAHHREAYADCETPYEAYAPAYHFGRVHALDGRLVGMPYPRAREALRALYLTDFEGQDYDAVEAAVRFGFEQGHAIKVHQTGPLMRNEKQVLDDDMGTEALRERRHTGAYTSVAPPPRQGPAER